MSDKIILIKQSRKNQPTRKYNDVILASIEMHSQFSRMNYFYLLFLFIQSTPSHRLNFGLALKFDALFKPPKTCENSPKEFYSTRAHLNAWIFLISWIISKACLGALKKSPLLPSIPPCLSNEGCISKSMSRTFEVNWPLRFKDSHMRKVTNKAVE